MKWIKVRIDYFSDNLPAVKEEIVGILSEIGIRQIEMRDFFSESSLDYNQGFKAKSDVWSISGYMPDNRFARKKLDIVYESLKEYSCSRDDFIYEIYLSECSDEDWQDEWKKYFLTAKITDRIVVKPSWDNYGAGEGEIVIEIDPGMAFGTGTHETTSLCIEFLEKYAPEKRRLLDIGCGSGILMLVGKKLGIEEVTGIDIDSKVEGVILENFARNGINSSFNIIIGNLVDNVNTKYDIVVSNILVDVLTELLEDVGRVLEEKAVVIFSGILKEKEDEFLKKCMEYGLRKLDRKEKNEWASIAFEYEG